MKTSHHYFLHSIRTIFYKIVKDQSSLQANFGTDGDDQSNQESAPGPTNKSGSAKLQTSFYCP